MATQIAPTENPQAADMHDILRRQRAAFMAELPVGATIRKDRIRRAIDLLKTHQTELVEALGAASLEVRL